PSSGVLDSKGYAVCPDCGTRVNCGRVGLANLESRHRGTKACQSAAQKCDAKPQKKNMSILTFLQKRPIPVPPVVAPARLLTPGFLKEQLQIQDKSKEVPISNQHNDKAAIITEL
ncbi:hypothetical protein H0H92_010725, partial [Tricholoma furcatifolium]